MVNRGKNKLSRRRFLKAGVAAGALSATALPLEAAAADAATGKAEKLPFAIKKLLNQATQMFG